MSYKKYHNNLPHKIPLATQTLCARHLRPLPHDFVSRFGELFDLHFRAITREDELSLSVEANGTFSDILRYGCRVLRYDKDTRAYVPDAVHDPDTISRLCIGDRWRRDNCSSGAHKWTQSARYGARNMVSARV